MSDYSDWEKMSREELLEELCALRMTVEEGGEILREANRAISGLAGELLKPCSAPCGGHLQEKGLELLEDGLAKYEALCEEGAREAEA